MKELCDKKNSKKYNEFAKYIHGGNRKKLLYNLKQRLKKQSVICQNEYSFQMISNPVVLFQIKLLFQQFSQKINFLKKAKKEIVSQKKINSINHKLFELRQGQEVVHNLLSNNRSQHYILNSKNLILGRPVQEYYIGSELGIKKVCHYLEIEYSNFEKYIFQK
jgi:hypothetical protein